MTVRTAGKECQAQNWRWGELLSAPWLFPGDPEGDSLTVLGVWGSWFPVRRPVGPAGPGLSSSHGAPLEGPQIGSGHTFLLRQKHLVPSGFVHVLALVSL